MIKQAGTVDLYTNLITGSIYNIEIIKFPMPSYLIKQSALLYNQRTIKFKF
jgi:hypothetical protein